MCKATVKEAFKHRFIQHNTFLHIVFEDLPKKYYILKFTTNSKDVY